MERPRTCEGPKKVPSPPAAARGVAWASSVGGVPTEDPPDVDGVDVAVTTRAVIPGINIKTSYNLRLGAEQMLHY